MRGLWCKRAAKKFQHKQQPEKNLLSIHIAEGAFTLRRGSDINKEGCLQIPRCRVFVTEQFTVHLDDGNAQNALNEKFIFATSTVSVSSRLVLSINN